MRHLRLSAITLMLLFAFGSVGTVRAQGLPGVDANKCLSAKNKCVSKKLVGLLRCREKCQKRPGRCGQVQTDCEAKVMKKFDGGAEPTKGCFAKVESKENPAKPDTICTTVNDTVAMEARVDGFVNGTIAILEGGAAAECGNGVVDAGEDCDLGTLAGGTCDSATASAQPYGTLSCGAGCVFDTSGCTAVRFVDNGDGTISDLDTDLMWEKKTGTVGSFTACDFNPDSGGTCADLSDVNNVYDWNEAMGEWISRMNGTTDDEDSQFGLAGFTDWRMPTVVELQTILLAPHPCGTSPCIDPVFGTSSSGLHQSASTVASGTTVRWFVGFGSFSGPPSFATKANPYFVRAVRGERAGFCGDGIVQPGEACDGSCCNASCTGNTC